MAETLKYLFLLFGPNDVLPLDEWVLNTEVRSSRVAPTWGDVIEGRQAAMGLQCSVEGMPADLRMQRDIASVLHEKVRTAF